MTAILDYAIRRPSLVALARAFHAAVLIGTSMYCLLIYSPFTYQQFIKPQVSAGLAALAVWHSALYWLAIAVTALTLAPFLEQPRARVAGWGYLAAASALGVWLSIHPVLAQPDPARANLLYALVVLVPAVWLSVVDHLAVDAPPALAPAIDRRSAAACWTTALVVWATFVAAAPVRLQVTGGMDLPAGRLLFGLAASLVAHLTAFALVWAALMTASGVAALSRSSGRVEYRLLAALSAVASAAVVMTLVLGPIAIAGAAAWLMSAAVGGTVAAVWSGVARHVSAALDRAAAPTALDAWLAPIVTKRSRAVAVAGVAVVTVAAQALIVRVATFDWDFMIQKLAAVAAWVVVFAFVHAAARERRGPRRLWMAPAFVLLLAGAGMTLLPRVSASSAGTRLNPEFALDAYAAADPSYRVIRDALRPRTRGDALAFYAYLRANAGVHDAQVEPAPIDFVRDLRPSTGFTPHIFLFIVDSLRPDYLSVHNPAVAFTPAIEAFASDSYPFARAFTRYAGTGLAVPSIWAGGLLFHKEYVTPFAPMNALKKLLDANQYRQYVAADHITDQLFVPAHDMVPLVRTVSEMQHGFCLTIDDLIARLTASPRDERPIFGHARTLDLHIGNIWSAEVPPGESYPGFFGPYAARVRAIDACFGRFVAYLKQARLYEDSVIVLTSDHGDSLGEDGRWGHGFTIFPEVLRIPLIIRLPPALRRGVETDLARVSFTTDITPTLYALLGMAPEALGPQFGTPLFVPPGTDLSWRKRESYLVASSYGPSYGLIQDNGRSLYFADATYGREYAFDLRAGPAGRRVEVTAAARHAGRRRIRDEVAAIAARYDFRPEP